jgi:hypothetical protein
MQTPRDVLPGHKIDHLSPPMEAIACGLRKVFKVENLDAADRRIHQLLNDLNKKQ